MPHKNKMVERYRRGKSKKELLGSHQKCWIWGRHVVLETLRAARWPVLELKLSDRLSAEERDLAYQLAESLQIPAAIEPPDRLTGRCRSGEHQGYLAKMTPYCYADAESLLTNRPASPLYAILDSIQDPYNFGAVIRSANAMGVDALFVARKHQVPVTSLVARTSAGAVNHIALAQVDNLNGLAKRLQDLGIAVVCANHEATTDVFDHDFRQPTAIVMGNEGTGIRDSLLQACDRQVRILQSGDVDCLNAAVAAGILFYEAARQRVMRPA